MSARCNHAIARQCQMLRRFHAKPHHGSRCMSDPWCPHSIFALPGPDRRCVKLPEDRTRGLFEEDKQ